MLTISDRDLGNKKIRSRLFSKFSFFSIIVKDMIDKSFFTKLFVATCRNTNISVEYNIKLEFSPRIYLKERVW